jgi:hypothetical protein
MCLVDCVDTESASSHISGRWKGGFKVWVKVGMKQHNKSRGQLRQ